MVKKLITIFFTIAFAVLIFLTGVAAGYNKGYIVGSNKNVNEKQVGEGGQIYCPNCGSTFTIDHIDIHLK